MDEREKTTVVVKTSDDEEIMLSGDTVIVFTVSDLEKPKEGKGGRAKADTGYIGYDIPAYAFSDVLSSLVSSFIEKRYEDKENLVGYILHTVASSLMEEAERVTKKIIDTHTDVEIAEMNGELARIILFGEDE